MPSTDKVHREFRIACCGACRAKQCFVLTFLKFLDCRDILYHEKQHDSPETCIKYCASECVKCSFLCDECTDLTDVSCFSGMVGICIR